MFRRRFVTRNGLLDLLSAVYGFRVRLILLSPDARVALQGEQPIKCHYCNFRTNHGDLAGCLVVSSPSVRNAKKLRYPAHFAGGAPTSSFSSYFLVQCLVWERDSTEFVWFSNKNKLPVSFGNETQQNLSLACSEG
ncbi:hypothetical protein CEXT_415391 [Caerostris extrusa]|uniref:Uncharacterized protein n=1 Tax=Caerostris extrusa TaxID=172846 RepID=A0AAV4U3V0_CAEEX|nr:hypothetical protein CEXT_415391 [Caerostris extrusa]